MRRWLLGSRLLPSGKIGISPPAGITLVNGLNSDIVLPWTYDQVQVVTIAGPSGAFSVGGFLLSPSVFGIPGQIKILRNTTAFAMTIVNGDASSSLGARITTNTGADVVQGAGNFSVAGFVYISSWVLLFNKP